MKQDPVFELEPLSKPPPHFLLVKGSSYWSWELAEKRWSPNPGVWYWHTFVRFESYADAVRVLDVLLNSKL